MTRMRLLLARILGQLRVCPVCHKNFDYTRPKGMVVLESWGRNGFLIASNISTGTCCKGTWLDIDYVHHQDGIAAQVNSKPAHLVVPRSATPLEPKTQTPQP